MLVVDVGVVEDGGGRQDGRGVGDGVGGGGGEFSVVVGEGGGGLGHGGDGVGAHRGHPVQAGVVGGGERRGLAGGAVVAALAVARGRLAAGALLGLQAAGVRGEVVGALGVEIVPRGVVVGVGRHRLVGAVQAVLVVGGLRLGGERAGAGLLQAVQAVVLAVEGGGVRRGHPQLALVAVGGGQADLGQPVVLHHREALAGGDNRRVAELLPHGDAGDGGEGAGGDGLQGGEGRVVALQVRIARGRHPSVDGGESLVGRLRHAEVRGVDHAGCCVALSSVVVVSELL